MMRNKLTNMVLIVSISLNILLAYTLLNKAQLLAYCTDGVNLTSASAAQAKKLLLSTWKGRSQSEVLRMLPREGDSIIKRSESEIEYDELTFKFDKGGLVEVN
jgi:hypothetical protein